MVVSETVRDGLPEAGGGDVDEGGLTVRAGALEGHETASQNVRVVTWDGEKSTPMKNEGTPDTKEGISYP